MGLATVAQQAKLKPRSAPYWHKIANGKHIGLRKTATSSTWWARCYDDSTQTQVKRSLGDFGHLPANERFSAAQAAANEWFKHLDKGGRTDIITVREACARYADWLAVSGGKSRKGIEATAAEKAEKAREARRRFAQYVDHDPIAKVNVVKLNAAQVKAWRNRLENLPALVERSGKGCGRGKGKGGRTRARAQSTVNRDASTLKAALNFALQEGYATSATAWRDALADREAVSRRTVDLTRDQRRALIEAIEDEHLRQFVAVLAVLPLRPGALAALAVCDFNARQKTLRISRDKHGAGRVIPLPDSAATVIAQAAKNKLPAAPLFTRWDGKPWRSDEWVKKIRAAVKKANLPHGTVAYSLRHAAITDLVEGGLDLFHVAALAGTSIAMIEQTYGHLRHDRARDALAGLAL
jgi:integrase